MSRCARCVVVGAGLTGAALAVAGVLWWVSGRDPWQRANRLISQCEADIRELEQYLTRLERPEQRREAAA